MVTFPYEKRMSSYSSKSHLWDVLGLIRFRTDPQKVLLSRDLQSRDVASAV